MIYTVVWIPTAQDELAEIWNHALDRQDVADASNAIDSILYSDPYSYSEAREETLRIMFVPPLAVLFDVSEDDCLATVRSVWRPN